MATLQLAADDLIDDLLGDGDGPADEDATAAAGDEGEPINAEFEVTNDAAADPLPTPAIDASLPDERRADPPAETPQTAATPPTAPVADADTTESPIAHFQRQLTSTTNELAAAALERYHAEARLKAAKKRYDNAVELLNAVASKGPEHLPLFDGQGSDSSTPTVEASASLPAAEPTDAAAGDAWKAVPIRELEACGLRPKLIEYLESLDFATIGDLECVRASFDGLTGIEGIGKAKAQQIEDALLEWLSKNRDAAVLAEAAGTTAATANATATASDGDSPPVIGTDGQSIAYDDHPTTCLHCGYLASLDAFDWQAKADAYTRAANIVAKAM